MRAILHLMRMPRTHMMNERPKQVFYMYGMVLLGFPENLDSLAYLLIINITSTR